MTEEAAIVTYQSLATYRQEIDAWESAYYDLQKKSKEFSDFQENKINKLEGQFDELKKSINAERVEMNQRVRRAKNPGIGVFIGGGWNGNGYEPVIGIGVVWKLF